ncbi:MAG: glycosyltransferase family 2 protein [Ilumatobacter sp.]
MTSQCAQVVGNDWSALVPEPDASWTPHALVSICIPTRNPGPGLARTLRCLAAQTYPLDLIEVVIGDDGSDADIEIPDGLPFPVRVERREHTLDFGAGRARNTAGRAASGDILFFLDGDVVPERDVVASYARWFDRCELAAPMAICRFVDMEHLSDDELVTLVGAGDMAAAFAGADVDDQYWRELHFERTDDLRIERVDAFRVVVGATIACSAEQFRRVGGFPELGVRGVEDTAFGYRLHNDGAVLILDRDATHWHQGRRNLSDPGVRERINEVRAPYVESVMPVRGFRLQHPPTDPPVDVVPVARIRVSDHGGSEVAKRSLERLGSANLALTDGPLDGSADHAQLQVDLPDAVEWAEDTIERIWELLAARQVGVVRALVGGTDGLVVSIARTRAITRVAQIGVADAELMTAAGECFGVWWTDAASLGLVSPAPGDDSTGGADRSRRGRFRSWRSVRVAGYRREVERRGGGVSSRLYDLVVSALRALTK